MFILLLVYWVFFLSWIWEYCYTFIIKGLGSRGGKFKSLNIFIQWRTNVWWKTRNSDQISLFDSAKVFIDFFLFFKCSFLLPSSPPLRTSFFLLNQSLILSSSYFSFIISPSLSFLHFFSFLHFSFSRFLLPSFPFLVSSCVWYECKQDDHCMNAQQTNE